MATICTCFSAILVFILHGLLFANEVDGEGPRRLGHRIRRDDDGCVNKIIDQQQYYTVRTVRGEIDNYWEELKNDSKQHILATTQFPYHQVNLTFGFQFFGETMDHVYLTAAGGLAMHPVYPDVNGTIGSHFIGPFWDYFNLSLSEDSGIYFESTGEKLVVEWRNVYCYTVAPTPQGPLLFETIVHRDGTILFLYKKMPSHLAIKSSFIGLRSGIDLRNKDIRATVSYRSVENIAHHIRGGTVIIFSPFSVCDLAKDSKTCSYDGGAFYCKGCAVIQHCPDHVKAVHQWLTNNCKKETPASCISKSHGLNAATVVIILILLVVIVLFSLLGGWIFYAYRHPTTPSGRWLIEHRPSQWMGIMLKQRGLSKDDQDDIGY